MNSSCSCERDPIGAAMQVCTMVISRAMIYEFAPDRAKVINAAGVKLDQCG